MAIERRRVRRWVERSPEARQKWSRQRRIERAFDVTVSLVGLVASSPVMLAAAAAVKLDSPGPVFFKGRRVGREGRVFSIHKLRTMGVGAHREGPAVTSSDDPRVTRVGHILRKTKVDELPQLFNILKGEMSFVGPRPEDPRYVEHYTDEQRRLLRFRPGLTGPAAIEFIDEEKKLEGPEPESTYLNEVLPAKLDIELAYVRKASLADHIRILLKTIALVARRPFSSP
ncbi:MAG TPA: sugar transferase [Candidatus Dormibacteraeota bacterium]|nr:sugar transferase [Candidatus Dormibacteraeota bacterium]